MDSFLFDLRFAARSLRRRPTFTLVAATIYTPAAQRMNSLSMIIRTLGDPAALTPALRAALRDADRGAVMTAADVMDDRIRLSFGEERFRTMLIDLFGVMAAVLAAAGMYGVTARAAGRRAKELGIRVALGATPLSVVRLMMDSTLAGVSVGAAIGTAASLVASRVLAPYLYGVSSHDPATYALVLALLAIASLVASAIPAQRAARVAPVSVLRSD